MLFPTGFDATRKVAIAYHRHSAEDKQENSVEIQHDAAVKFAEQWSIDLIHEISDEGKTGLLADRPGFNSLFRDWILNPDAPHFDYVLVYDVSRWGRFQDQNEAGHYEFLCKGKGKQVIYVSRGFPHDDQQLISSLQTSIERYMAAEYSRQLSDKVFNGSVKVVQQGYSAGGTPCYGMARLLLDVDKKPIGLLKKGEHKVIANQRVAFIPANDDTTEIVKRIFNDFLGQWRTPMEISDTLNYEGVLSPGGSLWNAGAIFRILSNEVYMGDLVYNRKSNKLKKGHVANDRSKWIITKGAFDPVINEERFIAAQERLYWFNASIWQRGRKMINKFRHRAVNELHQLLYEKQFFNAVDILSVNKFPIVFAVTCYDRANKKYWCFRIPEAFLTSSNVICIGAEVFDSSQSQQVFMINQDRIQYPGICLIHEDSDLYKNTVVAANEVQDKILEVVRDLD